MKGTHSTYPFHTNLALLIKESGMTQTQLAKDLNLSRTTLSHWCTGRLSIPEHWRSIISQRLHCAPNALFVIAHSAEDRSYESILLKTSEQERNEPRETRGKDDFKECGNSVVFTSLEEDAMDRRQALRAGATFVAGQTTLALWERLHCVIQRGHIDRGLITTLQTRVQECWQFQPDIAGIVSRSYLDQVKHELETTIHLLEGSLLPSLRKQLTGVASEFALIIGVMYQDLHEPLSARQYFSVALEAAQESDLYSLQSVILGWMSMLPGEDALSDVQKALPFAKKHATATTASWVAARMAEVYASQSPYDKTYEKAALHALEQASTVASRGSADDPYWTGFDSLLQAGYRGACYLKLHCATEAEAELRAALCLEQKKSYHQAVLLIDLADALGQQQRIEDACEPLHQALPLVSQAQSPILWQRARQCRKSLNQWSEEACIKMLDYHLSTASTSF